MTYSSKIKCTNTC